MDGNLNDAASLCLKLTRKVLGFTYPKIYQDHPTDLIYLRVIFLVIEQAIPNVELYK